MFITIFTELNIHLKNKFIVLSAAYMNIYSLGW